MSRFAIKGIGLGGWIAFAFALNASAQFHAKTPAGQTGVNQQAVVASQQQGANGMVGATPASTGGGMVGGGIGGGDTIMPEGAREALKREMNVDVRLSQMQGKPVEIWGRSIHHGNETYTESKQDAVTNTLEQLTKSKNGVLLQRRMITLDEMGRPGEALIYDGRNQFKYRGLQIYDTFGRFSEEQLFDAKGTLIRRKVQEYDPRGEKLPVRSWDYVANIPEDLKLVITREDGPSVAEAGPGRGSSGPGASQPTAAPKKAPLFRGIFGSKKQK